MTETKHSKPKKTVKPAFVLRLILVVLLVVIFSGIAYLAYTDQQAEAAKKEAAAEPPVPVVEEEPAPEPEVVLPSNPIDFPSLQAQNVDIQAWLKVPGTNIDYAVCQSPTNDFYYMDHDSNGGYSKPGSLYFELANKVDFSDPVTVIYGHNGYSDTMFSTLHNFEHTGFFDANEYFYIYRPGHVLTYRIISAFMYDDRHILNSFNFSDPTQVQSYFDMISSPQSLVVNVREGIDLTTESKVVQLSTCMTAASQADSRYIVSGVLVDDELTK